MTGRKWAGKARVAVAGVVLAATGVLTVTFVSSGGKGTADAATELSQYVPIQRVAPAARKPTPGRNAATGRAVVDCGTNRNGKFSPDNPVAQPGIKNGAEHVHDFVGNLAITATSSDAELAASGTTCRNGDRSSYFWPVLRVDPAVRPGSAGTRQALARTVPNVSCPRVGDRVPAGRRAAVARWLAELDRLTSAANVRMNDSRGRVDAAFNASVIEPLRAKRAELISAISRSAYGRSGQLVSLVDCDVSYDSMHKYMPSHSHSATPGGATPPAPQPSSSALPEPQGKNLELPNNTGGIQRPRSVLIEYRGNAKSKVVAMPRFLRALTGDAKPTSRGPANARPSWTCSGFGDRLSDKYPICPSGSLVQRVHDFPGCWDGKNIDSANHRSHLAFADAASGACPSGTKAIPQLRITLSYAIPREQQVRGQFALDSFPEEDHNPFSDHDDFVNVNSERQMKRIVAAINSGRTIRAA
ncbi:DUF1996 domain-containing protein [Actinoplanes sp. NPDC051859]|uniref:DUF1996 domain-containing protein n=1 Tax=Actinoplanes sp. NPDC051859 TaxID=3363909 RepID=UPI0037AAB0A3